jgi:16S rRNA (guanine966-N2)-methyltransferase
MRIIAGEAKGRRFNLPKGCRIRPTADRVKESLFDMLYPVEGVRFLDMFAGCGNCGLEALSRGARYAVFLEKEPRLVDAIRENLRLLGFEGRAEIVSADAEKGVRRLAERAERFDILFADPPYEEGFLAEIMKWLERVNLLADNGIIVLQHSVREALEGSSVQAMAVADQRRYGDTMLSFLKKRVEAENP